MQVVNAHNPSVGMWTLRKPDFETAVKGELPILFRVARRLVKTDEEAEDLVQQALVKAFPAWKRFDGRHVRSWLIRIMRNEYLMGVRSAGKLSTSELTEDSVVHVGFWDEVAWRDQAHRLIAELDGLPEEYRSAVVLCDIEQLTYEEAAASMDVPIGTVRSRLARGRAMLRQRLTTFVEAQ